MKSINVFLIMLVMIGLAVFVAREIWVPKVAPSVIEPEPQTPAVVEPSSDTISFKDGTQCFSYSHKATDAEPYDVTDFLTLNIAGDVVTGKKTGFQSGPGVSNGYEGSLAGKVEGDTITAVLSYIVEGSQGKEKEIYVASKDGIDKLRYQLIEEKGILVPDTTKEYKKLFYAKADCREGNI